MTFSMEFRDILRIVGRGRKLQRDLTTEEAAQAMRLILSGEVSEAQIGGFLVTMRVKEETVEEIIGFTNAAREALKPFGAMSVTGLVDMAFPYNGKSRRLQTGVIAALVLAAGGIPVLLHGADHIPTKAGVAPLNLLDALGYPSRLPVERVQERLERTNFGVLDIGHVLPQWTSLTEVRHQFGVRTLMNTVEKLLNPANAPIHISGFYHGSYLNRMARALPALEGWIVQGDEGGIDLRPGKKTRVYHAEGDEMVETMIDSTVYGFEETDSLDMPPDVDAHVQIIRDALQGKPGPAFDQIILTAGVLFWMVGHTARIEDGIERARQLIADGVVQDILEPVEVR